LGRELLLEDLTNSRDDPLLDEVLVSQHVVLSRDLVVRQAQGPSQGGVGLPDRPAGIRDPHRERALLHHPLEEGLGLQQRLLGLLLVADVDDVRQEPQRLALLIAQEAGGHVGREVPAVLCSISLLEGVGVLLAGEQTTDACLAPVEVVGMGELGEGHGGEVRCVVSEQAAERRVDLVEAAVEVGHALADGSVLEEGSKLLLGLALGPLELCDSCARGPQLGF
jgi:hypothetical protein